MARKDEVLEESDVVVASDAIDDDVADAELDIDEIVDVAEDLEVDDVVTEDDEKGSDSQDGDDEEVDAALDELEAEELELLAEEAADTLLVDEAVELREIRRAELALNVGAEEARVDEFVCSSCFLVKRTSQLANKRKLICRDCE
jgi:hypothetical protein